MFVDLIMCTIFALIVSAITVPVVYLTREIFVHTRRPIRLIRPEDMPFMPSVQEDPRTIESIKRTRKTFEQQLEQMNARALKAHSPECPDPWTCTKENCFKFEPDKIIGNPVVELRKTVEQRTDEDPDIQMKRWVNDEIKKDKELIERLLSSKEEYEKWLKEENKKNE